MEKFKSFFLLIVFLVALALASQPVFAREISASAKIIAMFDGTMADYSGLSVSSSAKTNIVLEKNSDIYTITIGDEIANAGSASFTISGLANGTYSYSLDGQAQTSLSTNNGSLTIPLSLGKREIRLGLI